jgi:hypothetical protein
MSLLSGVAKNNEEKNTATQDSFFLYFKRGEARPWLYHNMSLYYYAQQSNSKIFCKKDVFFMYVD